MHPGPSRNLFPNKPVVFPNYLWFFSCCFLFLNFPSAGPFPWQPSRIMAGVLAAHPQGICSRPAPREPRQGSPRSTGDFEGFGECRHHGRRWAGQQEPLLTFPHGRKEKKKAGTGIPSSATKQLEKKGLSVKIGSHSNVPSAVSPRELMEKSVALPYLLKCLSSPPFLCSAFPISKWLKLLKLGPDRDPLTESSG